MASPRTILHAATTVIGVGVGAALAVFTGDPAVTLMLSGGAMAAVGYWLGGIAHRRHG